VALNQAITVWKYGLNSLALGVLAKSNKEKCD